MKYFGEPLQFVIDYKRLKHVFRFDENGEFETTDQMLINWMKKNKSFIRCEESATAPAAVNPFVAAFLKTAEEIENRGEAEPEPEPENEPPLFKCDKCDKVYKSQGALTAHIRKVHG